MSTYQRLDHRRTSPDGTTGASLRWAARLLLAGQVLFIAITQFHTGGDANDHHSIFAKYAVSADWQGVHALQFLAIAVIVAGLVVFASALERLAGGQGWMARIGSVLAVVSLALYGVLQAVDGIGNKQVDHAWMTSSATEKPARFASAETMRWLEWGMSSYHAYATGLALLAFAVAAVRAAGLSLAISCLIALSGLAYLAEGWVAGSQGFSALHSAFIIASWLLGLAWMIGPAVTTRSASVQNSEDASLAH
jgi:hypothetical protein